MKHIDKLKASGSLHLEDRREAAENIRETIFGKYTKEQIEAATLAAGQGCDANSKENQTNAGLRVLATLGSFS
jgi:hypothetical protein